MVTSVRSFWDEQARRKRRRTRLLGEDAKKRRGSSTKTPGKEVPPHADLSAPTTTPPRQDHLFSSLFGFVEATNPHDRWPRKH
jgi:hypothetical protein